jgi:biotin transport system substrate-specific component
MHIEIVNNRGLKMEINMYIDNYKNIRYNFFKWRYELNLAYKIILALSFACLTGLLAQYRFYLPFSPVPITGQTFAVILAGVVLGKWGGISQGLYVGIGALGMPWFAGMTGGITYLAGPTGGYLLGFILASFFLGYCVDNYVRSRKLINIFALMVFANIVIIYIPGLIYLNIFMGGIGIEKLLIIGLIPFIIGDIFKIIAASLIAYGITPKQTFGPEVYQS